jgi:carbonic anhydrase
MSRQPAADGSLLVREAVRANVRASVRDLQHGSELLESLVREKGLMIVGAEYSMETGAVEFLTDAADDPPNG